VPFKSVVLQHIRNSLPAAEWSRLRALADDERRRCVDRSFQIDADASPAALLDVALSTDSISVDKTLVPVFKVKAVEIGQIEGRPVHYIHGEGIYLWGLEPAKGFTLSFWVTFPAYPPSW
jgi:hypothetical protein